MLIPLQYRQISRDEMKRDLETLRDEREDQLTTIGDRDFQVALKDEVIEDFYKEKSEVNKNHEAEMANQSRAHRKEMVEFKRELDDAHERLAKLSGQNGKRQCHTYEPSAPEAWRRRCERCLWNDGAGQAVATSNRSRSCHQRSARRTADVFAVDDGETAALPSTERAVSYALPPEPEPGLGPVVAGHVAAGAPEEAESEPGSAGVDTHSDDDNDTISDDDEENVVAVAPTG